MVKFLPTNQSELKQIGWNNLDIILISGDAYIDHPSFGTAIIGRVLENRGYKVGIISQPDWNSDTDFLELGRPAFFFGITAGNMDSMVNHYTAQKRKRSNDAYSPDDKPGSRPDRATIVYANKIKQLFPGIPIIIGGIEASLRRLPHYDYWSDKIRNSILFDSRANILVYGMGEKPIIEIADKLKNGAEIEDLKSIRGTVISVKDIKETNYTLLPEYKKDFSRKDYIQMYKTFWSDRRTKPLYQSYSGRYLKHNPPAKPLSQSEIDEIYELDYVRKPHPKYGNSTITAFEQIKLSITSHRGCFGGCSFCTLAIHQGKTIQSRSEDSILKEIRSIKNKEYFKGTITDIGGPTANMYGLYCSLNISETCKRSSCLFPVICEHLTTDHTPLRLLLKKVAKEEGIKHVFIASGIRHDLALEDKKYIRDLAANHTSGLLKLAPEHKNSKVLKLMKKPEFSLYEKFQRFFSLESKNLEKKQFIIPYIIAGHPGSDLNTAIELAVYLKQNRIKLHQVQEFTPTPMSYSTYMYFTGVDENDNSVNVPRGREMKLQKALIQWFKPENKKYIKEALKKAERMHLIKFFFG